jgi:HSP20 family protein
MLPVRQSSGSLATNEAPVNRLATIFDRFFNDDLFAPLATRSHATMPISMWEDENNFHVEVDAPGMTDKDIDVTVHADELVIRGERQSEDKGNGYNTRRYGKFEQRISLPGAVQADKVEGKLANGVLSLTCPKNEEVKPRKIALKSE